MVRAGANRSLAWMASAACLLACGGAVEPESQPSSSEPSDSAIPEAALSGEIVPTSATDIYPPLIAFSASWWSLRSFQGSKLLELAEDGARVKAGDPVALFEVPFAQKFSQWVTEERAQTEANAHKTETASASDLAALKTKAHQTEIAARRAALELEKEAVVSATRHAVAVLDHRIAEFEARAAARQLAAQQDKIRVERAFFSIDVFAAKGYEQRINALLKGFEVRAPHDGVVRHLFLPTTKRKPAQGDSVPGWKAFMAIARDEELSVRFFVPESRFGAFPVGTPIAVTTLFSDKPVPGVVRDRQPFPQELGIAKNDLELPNAREIVYVVSADLKPRPAGLSTGLEVKVRRR